MPYYGRDIGYGYKNDPFVSPDQQQWRPLQQRCCQRPSHRAAHCGEVRCSNSSSSSNSRSGDGRRRESAERARHGETRSGYVSSSRHCGTNTQPNICLIHKVSVAASSGHYPQHRTMRVRKFFSKLARWQKKLLTS